VAVRTSDAFTVIPRNVHGAVTSSSTSALDGRKKGDLGKRVSVGGITTSSKSKSKNKNKKAKKNQQVVPATAVSSSLSAWASALKDEDGENASSAVATATASPSKSSSDNNDTSASFQPFEESTTLNKASAKKGSRRERSRLKETSDGLKQAKIDAALENITDLVQNNNLSIKDLLAQIKALTQLSAPNTLKAILNQNLKDYTLAWVGSDEAICHFLGTGLHNVPLARLQDIFLTVGRDGSGESNTIRLMEVISILGPFPNVRNTLEGKITEVKSMEGAMSGMPLKNDCVQICYETMFDGLGKEISAGTKDNLRFADLNIVFADDRVLVCVVPTDDGGGGDGGVGLGFGEKGRMCYSF